MRKGDKPFFLLENGVLKSGESLGEGSLDELY